MSKEILCVECSDDGWIRESGCPSCGKVMRLEPGKIVYIEDSDINSEKFMPDLKPDKATLGDGESFVAMVVCNEHDGKPIYVASNRNIYKIVNDKLVPLEFAMVEDKS